MPNYKVTMTKASESWANGKLIQQPPPLTGYKYQGKDTTPVVNSATNVVTWSVNLVNGSTPCTVSFSGGSWGAATMSGSANSTCFSASSKENPDDTWSAESEPGEDLPQY
jgi:hypothetical protein